MTDDDASTNPKRVRGLLEQSHPKHDMDPIRVGPFEFIVNCQHPPIDPRTRIMTTCVVISTMFLSLVAWMLLTPNRPKRATFVTDILVSGLILSAVVELTSRLAIICWWRFRGYRREKKLLPDLLGRQSVPTSPARLIVRGRPSELLRFAEIRDAFFEPQVFHSSHRMIGMKLENRAYFGLLLALVILASMTVRHYGIWIVLFTTPLLYILVRGVPDAPTYYRFVPGRLDFLWFPWFRRRKASSWIVSLRDVIIQIDLTSRREMIIIASQVEPVEFRRDNVPEPLNFSLALVRAALSTATLPPLPMDALTG